MEILEPNTVAALLRSTDGLHGRMERTKQRLDELKNKAIDVV